jgi:glycosyltransferase involved in cell wall biosynthesis
MAAPLSSVKCVDASDVHRFDTIPHMGRITPSDDAGPLRILMVAPTSFFADYGCHVRIYEETRALQARGHRVRICTYHNGNDLPDLDIRRSVDVPWLKRAEVGSSRHKAYLDVALFVETLRQAVAFKPDVIHGHLHEGALIGGVVGRLLRTPQVFDYQGSLTEEMLDHGFIRERGRRERVFRRLERFIDRLPSTVIPSSNAGKRHLLTTGTGESRIVVVHDGVDIRRFDPGRQTESRARLRHRMGIPASAKVVVYLGLLAEYQGTNILIDAARQLLQRHDDLYVVIAGYPGADRYASLASDMPVDGRVLFPGRVPYELAPSMLAIGDVAVAPKLSTTESNGKLFNYMAMRLPVVASDTPTNREILGELGHLVEPGDASALADGIERALNDGEAERDALRRRVIEHYSWSERIADVERTYMSALRRDAALDNRDSPAAEPVEEPVRQAIKGD